MACQEYNKNKIIHFLEQVPVISQNGKVLFNFKSFCLCEFFQEVSTFDMKFSTLEKDQELMIEGNKFLFLYVKYMEEELEENKKIELYVPEFDETQNLFTEGTNKIFVKDFYLTNSVMEHSFYKIKNTALNKTDIYILTAK